MILPRKSFNQAASLVKFVCLLRSILPLDVSLDYNPGLCDFYESDLPGWETKTVVDAQLFEVHMKRLSYLH